MHFVQRMHKNVKLYSTL